MLKLCSKLKALKTELKRFNQKHYGSISERVKQAKLAVETAQIKLNQNQENPGNIQKKKDAMRKYCDLALADESFYKQKARKNWTKLGDQNTSYFHKMMKSHIARNKILSIMDSQQVRCEEYDSIEHLFSEYHKSLLGASFDYPENGGETVAEVINQALSANSVSSLADKVTEEEIKSTLFSLPSHKAPGPDGYPADFFKSMWQTVGKDFADAIKSFFDTSKIPKGVNATSITLIPKVPNPNYVTDFSPISCCTTVYKCISKIIANRLKAILPQVISSSQTAYLAGRSISDQVLLMQELVVQ